MDSAVGALGPLTFKRYGEYDAEYIISCVDATRDLKNCKSIWSIALKFRKLFALSGSQCATTMGLVHASSDIIRKGRVRLDLLALLLWRKVFRSFDPDHVSVHLFSDGSPQWRGLELFASIADIFYRGIFFRRLLPVVSLSKGQMDHLGKTFVLMWQICMMFGIQPEDFLKFRLAVRSLTTDLGTERFIVDVQDVVLPFYLGIDPNFPLGKRAALELHPFLFPYTLHMPGWKHIWDNILRRSLCSLTWFPQWLQLAIASTSYMQFSSWL